MQHTALRMALTRNHSIFNEVPHFIREEIFAPHLVFRSWAPTFPALLIALQGAPSLYQEALAILYKRNVFKLDGFNAGYWWVSERLVLGGIRHLWVDVDKTPCTPNHNPDAHWLKGILAQCTSRKDITIHCASHENSSHTVVSEFIREFPKWLSTLKAKKKIAVIIPYCKLLSMSRESVLPEATRDRIIESRTKEIDGRHGAHELPVQEVRLNYNADIKEDCDWYIWKVKAKEGEVGKVSDCTPLKGILSWVEQARLLTVE